MTLFRECVILLILLPIIFRVTLGQAGTGYGLRHTYTAEARKNTSFSVVADKSREIVLPMKRTRRAPLLIQEHEYPPAPLGANCRLVINEFSTDNPGADDNKQFVELKRVCTSKGKQRPLKLKGYKLIVVRGDDPVILFTADLEDIELFRDDCNKWFAVIGAIPAPELRMAKAFLSFQSQKVQSVRQDGIPNGNDADSPFAIILLWSHWSHSGESDVKKMRLKRDVAGNYLPLTVTDEIAQTLQRRLQDMVVYGTRAPLTNCDLFGTVFPPYRRDPENFVLRDWEDDIEAADDTSLNRCTERINPMDPSAFKLGRLSPGKENKCSSAVRFVLEDQMDMENLNIPIDIPNPDPRPGQCVSYRRDPRAYSGLTGADHQRMIQKERLRFLNLPVNSDVLFGPKDMELVTLHAYAASYMETGIVPWEDKSRFTDDAMLVMKSRFNHVWDPEELENQRTWAVPVFSKDEHNQDTAKIRCRFCLAMFENDNTILPGHSRLRTDIMRPSGFGLQSRTSAHKDFRKHNSEEIKKHALDNIHERAIGFVKEEIEAFFEPGVLGWEERSGEQSSAQFKHWFATRNMFELVILSTFSGLPEAAHPTIVGWAKKRGVDLGERFQGPTGCHQIVMHISEEMHNIFVAYMVRSQTPFSILVDSSTDNGGFHVMAIYIQVMEENESVIYLFRLVEIFDDESSQGLWEIILATITSEGDEFVNYFKTRIVGYGSDGASVMFGKHSSVYTRVRDYVGRHVHPMHCMSHRLHLVWRNSLAQSTPETTQIKKVEQLFRDVFKFLDTTYSQKRSAFVRRFCKDMEFVLYKIPKLYTGRWVISEHILLKKVLASWQSLVFAFDQLIALYPEEDTVKRATDLRKKLTNKNMLATMFFLYDLTGKMSTYSGQLQRTAETVIGKHTMVNELLQDLENGRTVSGTSFTDFLDNCTCTDALDMCTLEAFETGPVSYKEIELNEDDQEVTEAKPLSIVQSDIVKISAAAVLAIRAQRNEQRKKTEEAELTSKTNPSAANAQAFLSQLANLKVIEEKLAKAETDARADNAILKSYLLLKEEATLPVSKLRQPLLNIVLAKANHYFEKDEFKKYEILLPSKIPTRVEDLNTYGLVEIAQIATVLGMRLNLDEIRRDWVGLLKSIVGDDQFFQSIREKSAKEFWKRCQGNADLDWTDLIKQFLESVFVLPVGTHDLENGFSVMNSAKPSWSAKMTVSTLEAKMRIRINGNHDITKWSIFHFIKKWVGKGHCLVDDSTVVRRCNKPETYIAKDRAKHSTLF